MPSRPMLLYTRARKQRSIYGCVLSYIQSPLTMKKTLCVNLRSTVAKEDMEGPLGPRLKPFPRSTGSFLQFSKEGKGLLALRTTIELDISWLKQG